ncbi:transcription initiation factor TFIID subunit 6-like protein [Carex littledalei]|uniref:Transcription initiation factor TFIID subunit 6-like protein n=1 Tax=Carex littledalei TaxID=544730 RepID=A0A833V5Q8_9POAL|nr:transcription initiation factor TFIID subunit 6-like protein [Carex littledalei]
MSIVPKETIEVIAQSIGIPNLSPDVALALAPDVEYRLREIIQEAIKCMRHSKRTVLTTDDMDSALNLRNIEPIYGFASGDPLKFKRAIGHKDLFYLDDREVDFKEVIDAPLPKAPLDTAVVTHWLAIEGVQPAIPENPPIEAIVAPQDGKKMDHGKDDLPVDLKLPIKHVLSRELQLYFDKIGELILLRPETALFKEALLSLAKDSGLHPLVPYFSYFIADEVSRNLSNLSILFALMRVLKSLLSNPHIHIEPYLHQMMPSIITCLVAKRVGEQVSDNHWAIRDFAAKLVASICRRYGHVYHNLQSRLTKTLIHAFLDPSKALTQHYGAIRGLSALGPSVVRLLILPNLETYMQLLEPEMQLEKQKNELKRKEACRVYGSLLLAAGSCLYDRLRLFPGLLSPPDRQPWKTNKKIALTHLPKNKRKASSTLNSHQPPTKKLAVDPTGANSQFPSTDGPATSSSSGSNPNHHHSHNSSNNNSSNAGNTTNTNTNINNATGGGVHAQRVSGSAVLRQAWKEDMDAGHLLSSLHSLFGEGIFSFIQPAEMHCFI